MNHLPKYLLAAALVTTASAGEIGHQGGGSFNPGDFFAPPKGFVFSLYANYYATRALRDGNGNELNSVIIGGNVVDLDIDVEAFQIIPMFIWSPGIKFLGADVSSLVMPIYGKNSIAAELSTISQSSTIGDDAWGLQDSYVQPLWLTWRTAQWDYSTAYGFWAPTGSYDPAAFDNTGSGFWSHVMRASVGWSPDPQRQSLVNLSVAYEINSDKDGLDLTPGDHLTVDIGAKRVFNPNWEAGLFGFGQWQTSDDRGSNAIVADRDRLFGVGACVTWWVEPQKSSILLRHVYEFGARDRFDGSSTAIGFNLVF
jgi:hypothetical protein